MELSTQFLHELFNACLFKQDIMEAVSQHVEYHYIPANLAPYKRVLKDFTSFYKNTGKLPSIGIISQQNISDRKVQQLLQEIKDTKLQDKEILMEQLESFIKKTRFVELYNKVTKMYNNDEQEEAIRVQAKESEDIVNFSLRKDSGKYKQVFAGYKARQDKRFQDKINGVNVVDKISTGIDELDNITHGGTEKGQTDLFIGRSGTGKTTWLIHRAITSARRGKKVLFISAEDSEERLLAKIDSSWTAQTFRDIRYGEISSDLEEKLKKVWVEIINKGAEIDVIAFEQFDAASMKDVRDIIVDYVKVNGKAPDHLILDYLELFNPGDGRRYSVSTEGEKMRRQATAGKMTNLALEFNMVVSTALQTGDIAPESFNRPEFKITRSNASGDRNIANPFSLVVTWNTTTDEYKNNTGRLYVDKFRDEKGDRTIKIATNFKNSRFYDRGRTFQLFTD